MMLCRAGHEHNPLPKLPCTLSINSSHHAFSSGTYLCGSLGLAERLSTFLWMQHLGTFSRVMRSFLLSLSVADPHPQGFNDHQGLAAE